MRIMLTNNIFKKILLIIFVFFSHDSLSYEMKFKKNNEIVTIIIGKNKIIGISKNNNTKKNYVVNQPLINHLKKSDDFFYLFTISGKEKYIYVLINREISNPRPLGYCGAGHEDYILTIEISGRKINLLDSFLLQSCLENISLHSENSSIDGTDDIIKYISIGNNHVIKFFWLTDGIMPERELRIENGYFVLK